MGIIYGEKEMKRPTLHFLSKDMKEPKLVHEGFNL